MILSDTRLTPLAGVVLLGLCAGHPSPDAAAALPFFVGEKLTYDVMVNTGGKVGTGTMWVEGPIDVRGTSTYLLRFDSKVRIALFSGVSRSSSWFDPIKKVSLRYLKHERTPLTRDDESVEMYPDEKKWTAADGKGGEVPALSRWTSSHSSTSFAPCHSRPVRRTGSTAISTRRVTQS